VERTAGQRRGGWTGGRARGPPGRQLGSESSFWVDFFFLADFWVDFLMGEKENSMAFGELLLEPYSYYESFRWSICVESP